MITYRTFINRIYRPMLSKYGNRPKPRKFGYPFVLSILSRIPFTAYWCFRFYRRNHLDKFLHQGATRMACLLWLMEEGREYLINPSYDEHLDLRWLSCKHHFHHLPFTLPKNNPSASPYLGKERWYFKQMMKGRPHDELSLLN